MSNERQYYASGGRGMQLEGGQPAGQFAELYLESKATPQRVEAARKLFEEASLSDFERIGIRGRKWQHKGNGHQYVIDESQVLMAADPRKSGVEFFVVHGDRLLFLRPRFWDGNVARGVPGEILSGELRQAPGGGVRVVDRRTGAVLRENLRL